MTETLNEEFRLQLLVWNIQWLTTRSQRYELVSSKIRNFNPDIACLLESAVEKPIDDGFIITSSSDYGYETSTWRRKVQLFSRYRWHSVETFEGVGLPPGRIVYGVTSGLGVLGVCIPWRDAHVNTGQKNRRSWEDHKAFLASLSGILNQLVSERPVLVVGDFNQSIPRNKQPLGVYELLVNALSSGWNVHTDGLLGSDGKPVIDHVVSNSNLGIEGLKIIPKKNPKSLSDHDGLTCTVYAPS